MPWNDEKAVGVRSNLLVLLSRQRDGFNAAVVFALANKHIESPARVVRSLIELSERTFVLRRSFAPQVTLRFVCLGDSFCVRWRLFCRPGGGAQNTRGNDLGTNTVAF